MKNLFTVFLMTATEKKILGILIKYTIYLFLIIYANGGYNRAKKQFLFGRSCHGCGELRRPKRGSFDFDQHCAARSGDLYHSKKRGNRFRIISSLFAICSAFGILLPILQFLGVLPQSIEWSNPSVYAGIETMPPTQWTNEAPPSTVHTSAVLPSAVLPSVTPRKEPSAHTLEFLEAMANSEMAPVRGNVYFSASQLLDGRDDTCWQYRASNLKPDELPYAVLTLKQKSTVNEFWIKNGYIKNTISDDDPYEQYSRNARAKEIRLSYLIEGDSEYSFAQEIKLENRFMGSEWAMFSINAVHNVQAIKLEVLSYYPGSYVKFKRDVAISEIRFRGYEDGE